GIVPPADLDAVFVNNNLRNVLRESIAHLGLMSPDAAVRARAADALLEGITPETATLLREAYARESVAYVRDAMALSLAAADVVHADKAGRVAAVAVLAGRSEEHTSELQSRENLVCRLLLEKKKDRGDRMCEADRHDAKSRDAWRILGGGDPRPGAWHWRPAAAGRANSPHRESATPAVPAAR